MANMISERKTGAQGATVAANVQRLMEEQNLNSNSLARKIAEIEQPTELADGTVVHPSKLAALAIRRIVAGERKVDVDDLVLLAYALGVSPVTLMQPNTKDPHFVAVTPVGKTQAASFWNWVTARCPFEKLGQEWGAGLDDADITARGVEQRIYLVKSNPVWSKGVLQVWLRDPFAGEV